MERMVTILNLNRNMEMIVNLKYCFECGSNIEIHQHHVVPKVKGGIKTLPLCGICHGKVHGKNFGTEWRELQKEGIRKAKEKGLYKGRVCGKETKEKFLSKHTEIINLLNKGYSGVKISSITNRHPNTITKVKRIWKEIKITDKPKKKNKLPQKYKIIEGIRKAKENGVYKGRKKGSTDSKEKIMIKHIEIIELLDKGYSGVEISSITNRHPNTITKVKHIWKEIKK